MPDELNTTPAQSEGATLATDLGDFQYFIPITKVDEAKRQVWGLASMEEIDKAGEVMDYESSKPHFVEWSEETYQRTGGKSRGNLRSMHTNIAAGKVIDFRADDARKAFPIGTEVVDDQEWRKVVSGCYSGFSIGGKYVKRWMDTVNGQSVMRYTAKPSEVSLVDNPAVPHATFELVKVDGTIEQRPFVHGEPAVSGVMTSTLTDANGTVLWKAETPIPSPAKPVLRPVNGTTIQSYPAQHMPQTVDAENPPTTERLQENYPAAITLDGQGNPFKKDVSQAPNLRHADVGSMIRCDTCKKGRQGMNNWQDIYCRPFDFPSKGDWVCDVHAIQDGQGEVDAQVHEAVAKEAPVEQVAEAPSTPESTPEPAAEKVAENMPESCEPPAGKEVPAEVTLCHACGGEMPDGKCAHCAKGEADLVRYYLIEKKDFTGLPDEFNKAEIPKKEGEPESPPKGYPKDRSAYADPCVVGDTLIYTPKGVKRIDEIRVGDEVYTFEGGMVDVDSPSDVCPTRQYRNRRFLGKLVARQVLAHKMTGVFPIVRVRVGHDTIAGTHDHPVLTYRQNLLGGGRRVEWMKLGELKRGDVVIVAKQIQPVADQMVDLDWMRFLGFYVGDGYVHAANGERGLGVDRLQLACAGEAEAQQYASILSDKYPQYAERIKIAPHHQPPNRCFTVTLNSAEVAREVQSLGFGDGATNKTVPDWVFQTPRECIQSFIRGYIDADGHDHKASTRQWYFTTVSPALAYRMKALAKYAGYWSTNVYQKDAKPDPRGWQAHDGYTAVLYPDYLPNGHVQNLFGRHEVMHPDSKDFTFASVREVAYEKPQNVYDIKVEGDGHNFIANSFVAHNTNYSWPMDSKERAVSARAYYNAGKGKDKYSEREWAVLGRRIARMAGKFDLEYKYDPRGKEIIGADDKPGGKQMEKSVQDMVAAARELTGKLRGQVAGNADAEASLNQLEAAFDVAETEKQAPETAVPSTASEPSKVDEPKPEASPKVEKMADPISELLAPPKIEKTEPPAVATNIPPPSTPFTIFAPLGEDHYAEEKVPGLVKALLAGGRFAQDNALAPFKGPNGQVDFQLFDYTLHKAYRKLLDAGGFREENQSIFNKIQVTSRDQNELGAHDYTNVLNKGVSSTTAPGYYLHALVRLMLPVLTPMLSRLPRQKPRAGGRMAEWRVISGFANLDEAASMNVAEASTTIGSTTGTGQAINETPVLFQAPYRRLPVNNGVTVEAQYAMAGYDDAFQFAIVQTLTAFLRVYEMAVLWNNSAALGAVGTVTATAAGSGTLGGTNDKFAVTALTGYGWRQNQLGTGGKGAATSVQGETAATLTSATDLSTAATCTLSWAAIKGAVAYNIYYLSAGVVGSAKYVRTVYVNSTSVTAAHLAAATTNSYPTSDGTAQTNGFEGIVPWCEKSTIYSNAISNKPWTDQAGAALTLSGPNSISEIDSVLSSLMTNWQIGPSLLVGSPNTVLHVANKIGSATNAPWLINVTSGAQQGSLVGGIFIGGYVNKYSLGLQNTPRMIDLMAHPYMPDGTLLGLTETVPYPMAREARGWLIEEQIPLTYWPVANLTAAWNFLMFADAVLESVHPAAQFAIQGINTA